VKKIFIAALVSAQLAAGQPAVAAALGPGEQTRFGVFSGVQVTVPLGGRGTRAEAPRASLGIAPMVRSERLDGTSRTQIGPGLQLSLEPNRPVELNLAGQRLDRLGLTPARQTPDGQKSGISTLGWVGIGAGVVVLAAGGFAFWLHEAMECGPSDDEC
jgi:hypothetical protein